MFKELLPAPQELPFSFGDKVSLMRSHIEDDWIEVTRITPARVLKVNPQGEVLIAYFGAYGDITGTWFYPSMLEDRYSDEVIDMAFAEWLESKTATASAAVATPAV